MERLLQPGQGHRPNCGLRHRQLQHRRPGGHRGHKESGLGRLPQGGLSGHHQELGLVGWHRRGLRRGQPPWGQVEGLEFVTVPGGGSGAGDPGLRARAATLREAWGFPRVGQVGQAARWWVAHPPGGSRHPGARLRPPQAQQVPLGVLRRRTSFREATLRGWGWHQRAGAPGSEGVGPEHFEGWLPGRRHGRRGVGWWVRQGVCGAKRPCW